MNSSTSSSDRHDFARAFAIGAAALLLALAAGYWLVRIYFTLTGDFLPLSKAAERLLENNERRVCLYMNVISSGTDANLKFELFRRRKRPPELVVLGSSRVLALYQPMFRAPFLNMGRAYQFPAWEREVIDAIDAKGARPRLALIGVDFWWFNARYMRKSRAVSSGGITRIDPNDPRQLRIIVKRSWENPSYWSLLPQMASLPACPVGILARLKNVGYLPDGGVVYRITPATSKDRRFRDSLGRIRRDKGEFSTASAPDERQTGIVLRFMRQLRERGVKVVAYAPPVAPTVYRAMRENGDYSYIERAFTALKRAGITFHDYLDPARLGLEDCEFLDGFHPGDVANALLLLDMARREPQLSRVMDLSFLRRLAANRGMSMAISDALTGRKEGDHLGLGCPKRLSAPLPMEKLSRAYLRPPRSGREAH